MKLKKQKHRRNIGKLLYNTFDLIFLDINLMDESGIDLAQKLIK